MGNFLLLDVTDGRYNYEKLLLDKNEVEEDKVKIRELLPAVSVKKYRRIRLDSAFVSYLVKELKISRRYRTHFIRKWYKNRRNKLIIVLQLTNYDLIDYEWNDRVYIMVREKCELEHALSWLSTLGGAFSALGDYFPNCADTAGKISLGQLRLALRLGDPNVATRCRLYLSLSLIQKKKFKLARSIIENEYHLAKNMPVVDNRLIKMCHGIWSKLQYEYGIFRSNRQGTNDICRKMQKVSL